MKLRLRAEGDEGGGGREPELHLPRQSGVLRVCRREHSLRSKVECGRRVESDHGRCSESGRQHAHDSSIFFLLSVAFAMQSPLLTCSMLLLRPRSSTPPPSFHNTVPLPISLPSSFVVPGSELGSAATRLYSAGVDVSVTFVQYNTRNCRIVLVLYLYHFREPLRGSRDEGRGARGSRFEERGSRVEERGPTRRVDDRGWISSGRGSRGRGLRVEEGGTMSERSRSEDQG